MHSLTVKEMRATTFHFISLIFRKEILKEKQCTWTRFVSRLDRDVRISHNHGIECT